VSAAFDPPVRGPAHGRGQRAFATVAALLGLAALARMALTAEGATAEQAPWLLLALAAALLGSWYFLITSTTTLDAAGIVQTGLPERRVRWEEIAYAQVGGLPFARRLRVRTLGGRRLSFAGADAALLAAFDRVAAAHPVPQPAARR
jgi:hypothetical protein